MQRERCRQLRRLRGSNEKAIDETAGARLSGMQWHRISSGDADRCSPAAEFIRSGARTAAARGGYQSPRTKRPVSRLSAGTLHPAVAAHGAGSGAPGAPLLILPRSRLFDGNASPPPGSPAEARLPADHWSDATQQVFVRLLERVDPALGSGAKEEGLERKEFLRAIDAVKKRTQRAAPACRPTAVADRNLIESSYRNDDRNWIASHACGRAAAADSRSHLHGPRSAGDRQRARHDGGLSDCRGGMPSIRPSLRDLGSRRKSTVPAELDPNELTAVDGSRMTVDWTIQEIDGTADRIGRERQFSPVRELHHRLKNNLQFVLSLLAFQSARATDASHRA